MDFSGQNDVGSLALGLVIAGAAAGMFRGVLGFGGGLILLPVLYHVLGQLGVSEAVRLHLAAGTTLAALLPVTLAALQGHLKAKAVDIALVKRWSLPMLVGVVCGAALAVRLPSDGRVILFTVVAISVALLALLGKESWRIAEQPPRGIGGEIVAFALSALSLLMGVSGACVMTVVLRLTGSARASGTATALAAMVCAAGAVASVVMGWTVHGLPAYSYGYVNLMGFGITAPVMYATAYFGERYGGGIEAKRPRASFALVVILLAGKMVWDVVG